MKQKVKSIFDKSTEMLNKLAFQLIANLGQRYPLFGVSNYDQQYLSNSQRGQSSFYNPNANEAAANIEKTKMIIWKV